MKSDYIKVNGFFIPKIYDINDDNNLSNSEISIFCFDNDLRYDIETGKIAPATDDYADFYNKKKWPHKHLRMPFFIFSCIFFCIYTT